MSHKRQFYLRIVSLLLISQAGVNLCIGQQEEELIVALKARADFNQCFQSFKGEMIKYESIFRDLNLWSVTVEKSNKKAFIDRVANQRDVRYIHENVTIRNRVVPNDPDYNAQWSMDQIGMEEVWDITTGGQTLTGHDIVVGILDDGFQLDHPELQGRIWENQGEIPDNQIDDDNNGYVDDVFGINARTDTDEHEVFNHGTSVSGIIGAIGNNGSLMAGVNWDTKLMITSSGRRNEYNLLDVVEAYEYMYEQRKRFNESNGSEGAFVVVSNFSGGAPDLFPDDFPAWCEVLDMLGSVGILNVGATSNTDTNVDIEGDLPSTCPSDFLIVVTNTDRIDQKVQSAGYGTTGVDLGSPGDEIFTIAPNNDIDPVFFGTSASAPHVAGVVSLMYTLLCEESIESAISNPSEMALIMRNAILENATSIQELRDYTVTGGRLNALASIEAIDASLGDCCEITIDDLSANDESCLEAADGSINAVATGRDLTGQITFSLESFDQQRESLTGSFDRLASDLYTLNIFDDANTSCSIDTAISIMENPEPCPFGNFQITEIRQNIDLEEVTLFYDLDEQKDITIQVHDNRGQLLLNTRITPSLNEGRNFLISTVGFPAGIYHASIMANGIRDTQSFPVVR